MAREALGLVGAGVGYLVGGPIGAQIGFAVGSAVGGYIDPVEVPHPGMGEAPIQTGREGVDIPVVWGLASCHGNLIDQGDAYDVSKKRRSGKNSKVEEITRYKTFAIGICEGPIDGVSRIWENNKLVYDITGGLPADEHAAFAEKITIYTGTDDQMPDPDLEVIHGAGEVCSHRGLAYIVFPDYDVTDFGGAVPQYLFEVNGYADMSATSRPYPIEDVAAIELTTAARDGIRYGQPEGVDVTVTPQDGTLNSILNLYTAPPEGVDLTVTPQDGTLDAVLHEYTAPPEGVDLTVTPQDGTLVLALVSYDYETEGVDVSVTPLDGTLETP